MPTFQHDDISIHYEVHGQGRPVVLLHGICVTFRANFGAYGWIEALNAAGYQVIGLDLRGHGKSGKPTDRAAYGTAQATADVLALVDHLGLDKPAIVGFSMGSLYALDLAHRHPDRWSSVVLCATGDGLVGGAPSLREIGMSLAQALAYDDEPKDLPPHFAMYWTFATKVSGDIRALRAAMRGAYAPATHDEAARVKARTLVVSGAKDAVLGQGKGLAAAIPGARYVEIEGADHFALAIDPRAQQEIAAFLASA